MLRSLSDDILSQWLREDVPYGDATSLALGLQGGVGHLTLAARQPMTVCGVEEAKRLFELVGAHAQVHARSGHHVRAEVELLTAQGPAEALLQAFGVVQNLVQWASGVASEVARIVTELRAAGLHQPLACTRHTLPGMRALSVKAVQAGGGIMHHLGLSDAVQLNPEHRVFLDLSVDDMVGRLRRAQPEKKMVAQVQSLEEAMAFAVAGADILQLDQFTPEQVRQTRLALHNSRLHPALAVSGDVTAANAVAHAEAGADVLVSSAPYLAAPREVEARFSRALSQ
ncbi:MAG TPA: ModD protein [Aquabacterium sp.]|nr:ModD protein [Aquabacterium sp.]